MTRFHAILSELRRIHRCAGGASAVEFALIAPVLLVAILGLVDVGRGIFARMELTGAVRSGAQFALQDETDDATLIQAAVKQSTNLPATDVSVSTATHCECSDGAAISCSVNCSGGLARRQFMTITANYTYSPMFAPSDVAMSSSAVVRTR